MSLIDCSRSRCSLCVGRALGRPFYTGVLPTDGPTRLVATQGPIHGPIYGPVHGPTRDPYPDPYPSPYPSRYPHGFSDHVYHLTGW